MGKARAGAFGSGVGQRDLGLQAENLSFCSRCRLHSEKQDFAHSLSLNKMASQKYKTPSVAASNWNTPRALTFDEPLRSKRGHNPLNL